MLHVAIVQNSMQPRFQFAVDFNVLALTIMKAAVFILWRMHYNQRSNDDDRLANRPTIIPWHFNQFFNNYTPIRGHCNYN